MSSAGSVEVKIVGSVDGSLAASTAVAKAELQSLQSRVSSLASTMVKDGATADATLKAQLATLAGSAAEAKTRFAALSSELGEPFHASVSTATRESRALFDELSSGRTRMAPGTIAILAQKVFGLSGATLAAVGGVAALAAGIGYLTYLEIEAEKESERLANAFALTGRSSGASSGFIDLQRDALYQIPGLSRKAADGLLSYEASNAALSTSLINMANQLVQAYVPAFGDDATDHVKKLLAALSDLTESGFEKLDREMLNLSPRQAEVILNLLRMGDVAGAQKQVLQDLADRAGTKFEQLQGKIAGVSTKLQKARDDAAALMHALETGTISPLAGADAKLDELEKRIKKLQGELSTLHSQKPAAATEDADSEYKRQLEDAEKINYKLNERARLTAQITNLTKDLGDAGVRHDAEAMHQFAGAIKETRTQLEALNERQSRKATGFSSGGEEAVARAREQISEIEADQSKSDAQRQADVQRVYAQLLESGRLNAAQTIQVEKEKNDAIASAARRTAEQVTEYAKRATEEQSRVEMGHTQTDIAIARMTLDAKKDLLEQEVADGQITNTQKLQLLRGLTEEEDRSNIEALVNERQNHLESITEWEHYTDQIRLAYAKLHLDLAAIDDKIADSARQTSQRGAKAWKDADEQIKGAEDTLVSGIMSGRQTLAHTLENVARDLVTKEIEADLHGMTERMMFSREQLQNDTSLGQMGLGYNLLFEQEKTAAVVKGQTAQAGAVATGTAAQTTIKAGGAAASNAVEAASDSKSILNSAYTSAAGAYKSIMQTVPPPLNLVLAPIAAGATFAAVAAYDVVSAEGGQWQVGSAVQRTNLHMNEMVLPSRVAGPAREAFEQMASGKQPGSSGAGGDTFHTTLHNSFAGGWDSLMNDPRTRRKIEKHVQSALRRRAA